MKIPSFRLALLFLVLLGSQGCAYFRWSEPSYQEMHDRAQQQPVDDRVTYTPKSAGGQSGINR